MNTDVFTLIMRRCRDRHVGELVREVDTNKDDSPLYQSNCTQI